MQNLFPLRGARPIRRSNWAVGSGRWVWPAHADGFWRRLIDCLLSGDRFLPGLTWNIARCVSFGSVGKNISPLRIFLDGQKITGCWIFTVLWRLGPWMVCIGGVLLRQEFCENLCAGVKCVWLSHFGRAYLPLSNLSWHPNFFSERLNLAVNLLYWFGLKTYLDKVLALYFFKNRSEILGFTSVWAVCLSLDVGPLSTEWNIMRGILATLLTKPTKRCFKNFSPLINFLNYKFKITYIRGTKTVGSFFFFCLGKIWILIIQNEIFI